MNSFYADLHIHIGRSKTGRAIKITGAKSLTFSNIIDHARNQKGLDIVGIIDCHSPEVISEMEELLAKGDLTEQEGGGLNYSGLSIILGSELEIFDENCKGPIHVLCYFPTLEIMKIFSNWLSGYLKNIHLSSQRVYVAAKTLQKKVKELKGLFIPAHIFTPFKSLYGKGVEYSLEEVFDKDLIDGIELGLSADTYMADQLEELHSYTFLSNSDAHSLAKIAREYQQMEMEYLNFQELEKVLRGIDGRRVKANYGLDPLLGKYHQTVCSSCFSSFTEGEECPGCGNKKKIKGVAERIKELSNGEKNYKKRPPYIYQIPLEFIPGLGPKMLGKLLNHFGTEMAIIHEVPLIELEKVVPLNIAKYIVEAREGTLHLSAGGGGKYGKIMDS